MQVPTSIDSSRLHEVITDTNSTPARLRAQRRPDAAAARIREGVRLRSREIRDRHPWIQHHQSAIGLVLLLTSFLGMLGCAALFATGGLGAWAVIPAAAFFASIAHEIEHDLIHKCYFPTRRHVANVMLAVGWLMRPSTINPWVRRHLHLLHHRASGTEADIEERAITNGMPMGLRRLLVMTDGLFAGAALRPVPARARLTMARRTFRAYFPLGFVHYGLLYTWLVLHAASILVGATFVPPSWMTTVDFLFVVWIAPNVLRTFALHFISSNIHYYGDVEEGDVVRQTQVLDHWAFAPLQLFCANFGSTHGIHHFHVPDPFWLRQLTAPIAHRLMRENGVRFNDLHSWRRANRWGKDAPRPANTVRIAA